MYFLHLPVNPMYCRLTLFSSFGHRSFQCKVWHNCLSSKKKNIVSAETCVCNIFSLIHCKRFSLKLVLNIKTAWIFYQLSVLSFLIITLCLQETVGVKWRGRSLLFIDRRN